MSEQAPAVVCFDKVSPEPVKWLWELYLARGKLAILDGDPGTGKSFFAADLAARLSRGGPLPDGSPRHGPGTTLFLNAEDGLEDTLQPRLDAAGAALGQIYSFGGLSRREPGGTPLCFPYHLDWLARVVGDLLPDLVVIDPMMAFLPPEVSANNDQSIRMALTPLAVLAARSNTAILLVRHLNKGGGGKALYRGSGSIGIIGAIRTALFLSRHPRDPEQRVLAMSKSNLGPLAPTLAYRLAKDEIGRLRVEWTGACDVTADELCQKPKREEEAPDRPTADDWLKEALAKGPRKSAEVIAAGEAAGYPARTLERAKSRLGFVSQKSRRGEHGEWYWADPTLTPPPKAETPKETPPSLRQAHEERFGPLKIFPPGGYLDGR
jgi:hypothetical protein